MSTSVADHEHAGHPSQGRLWFGLLAGPFGWMLQFFLSFFIAWQACQDGDGDWDVLSNLEVRWLIAAVGLVVLVGTLAGIALSWRSWRALSAHEHLRHAEAQGREAMMALGGVLTGLLFVGAELWTGLGPWLLGVCVVAK